MALRPLIVAASAAVFLALTGTATAASQEPWEAAADVRTTLAEAQRALVLGEPEKAKKLVGKAAGQQLGPLGPAAKPGLADATEAVAAEDPVALEIARAATWTAILGRGRLACGRGGRSRRRRPRRGPGSSSASSGPRPASPGRAPTGRSPSRRWSRAGIGRRRGRRRRPGRPLRHVPGTPPGSARRRRRRRRAGLRRAARRGGLARPRLLRHPRGRLREAAERRRGATRQPASSRSSWPPRRRRIDAALESALGHIDDGLEGFRAAPLSEEEQLRRAGQLQRFLALVPIEYGRGVDDGRVTLDFEIQEAVTFRDGAAQALRRPRAPARRAERAGHEAPRRDPRRPRGRPRRGRPAGRGRRPRRHPGRDRRGARAHRLALSGPVEGGRGDRRLRRDLRHARPARGRDRRRAVRRRPSRRGSRPTPSSSSVRSSASAGSRRDLFVEVEGLFWYGADGLPGLAQLVKRKASPAEVAETRQNARRGARRRGSGGRRRADLDVRSRLEHCDHRLPRGLEAVLILAALMAGMVGAQARLRRPLLLGAGGGLRRQRRRRGGSPRPCSAASAATARSSRRWSPSSPSPSCS